MKRLLIDAPDIIRLVARIRQMPNGCVEWAGAVNPLGYGHIRQQYTRTLRGVHRVSYEYNVGPLVEGMEIDHLCRNRRCVNPDHLEQVTRAENVRRSRAARGLDTHCRRGHPYNSANTRLYRGKRYCRPCANQSRGKSTGRS